MENIKEPIALRKDAQNINVKFNIQDFSSIVYYIFHISNFAALLSTILLLLTYGTGSPFYTLRYLFTSFTLIVHASLVINYLCDFSIANKKDEDSSSTSLISDSVNKTILNKIILCSDVHDLTILLLFSYAGITPILYIFCYIITFSLNFINYTLKDVIPLLTTVCSPQNLSQDPNSSPEASDEKKNDLTSALDPLKKFSNSMVIKILPFVFQIIVTIQLFVITIFDLCIFNLLMFVVYISWEVMFDYATNAIYHNAWSKIGDKINSLAEDNSATYGNILLVLVKWFSIIGLYATQWYK